MRSTYRYPRTCAWVISYRVLARTRGRGTRQWTRECSTSWNWYSSGSRARVAGSPATCRWSSICIPGSERRPTIGTSPARRATAATSSATRSTWPSMPTATARSTGKTPGSSPPPWTPSKPNTPSWLAVWECTPAADIVILTCISTCEAAAFAGTADAVIAVDDMNETLRDRILRKLDTLPDERGYQFLDYIEFLESRYAQKTSQTPNVFQRFAEGVEDSLRAGRVSATGIAETMGLLSKAMGVLQGVAAAGKSVASDVMEVAARTASRAAPTDRPDGGAEVPSPPASPPNGAQSQAEKSTGGAP